MGRKAKAKANHERPTLTALELQVMRVVWELGDCTSREVTDAFTQQRPLAPTTVRSVLTKLRNKGYVEVIPSLGRGFLLRPTVKRETVARHSLRGLLDSLFQNSPSQAIAFLLDEADISAAEMEEIKRLIDSRKGEQS
jgi:predicted transcriptional regulator